jgi:trigger factor
MLTSALTRAHGISVDHSRVRARVDELASDSSKPDEVRNMYFQNPSLLAPIEAQVLDEQVVAWLAEKAVFTPVPTNFRLLKDR